MKLFVLSVLSALSFATVAATTPKVGDFASLQLNIQSGGNSFAVGLSREITGTSGSGFVVRQILSMPDGNQQVSETTEDASNFLTDAGIDELLANCSAAGGTLQTVSVPAGSFNTCAVPFSNESEDGIAWIGKVSFGLVQIQTTSKSDGTFTDGKLVSFR